MLHHLDTETTTPPRDPGSRKDAILSELQKILNSAEFRTSLRSREFLSYVVHEALDGDSADLKERSIGMSLYHRPATYITGDDPVVRVKATEVRKRLAMYYAENHESDVGIEIPLGSYVPLFRDRPSPAADPAPPPPAEEEKPDPAISPAEETGVQTAKRLEPAAGRHLLRSRKFVLASVAAAALAASVFYFLRPATSVQQFWRPLTALRKPVLICVPSPVSYALSPDVLKQISQPVPASENSELAMNTTPIRLEPETAIKGKEITPMVEYYVNKDDAYVMSEVSKLLTKLGEDPQLRIGQEVTFADLRSAPAVLIGAYNNSWTLKMGADLPYEFKENEGLPFIQDRANPGRTWRPEARGRLGKNDFAIVARLLNSKTGQPLIIIGGTGMVGTEAAGRLLSNKDGLRAALKSAPEGWVKMNLEMVLETDQVDESSSPPHVVAVTVW